MNNDNTQSVSYELIHADDPASLLETLVALHVCQPGESVTSVAKAGEGNMNLVLRVTTDQRSVIVKQARPWVEKYQEIAAPEERILSEIEFYRCVSGAGRVQESMPSVLASDASRRLMVLEDLGAASDYATLYGAGTGADEVDPVFEQAIQWVAGLHQCKLDAGKDIGCDPLRELNHAHIFSIPLNDPPAIDLDSVCEGLTEFSRPLCADDSLQKAMESLGKVYLDGGGGPLLHGDYYPGSWLKTGEGFRVIDPEFCFCGPREFDLGVVAAHWIFCGSQPGAATIDRVCQIYSHDVSRDLLQAFAGVELVRRLLGVAQLPLDADLDRRKQWLECGVQLLKEYL